MMLITALIVAGFTFTLFLLFRRTRAAGGSRAGRIRKPIEDILSNPQDIKYEIKERPSLSITGRSLRFSIRLMHSLFGRSVLLPFLKRRNNFDIMDGEYIPEVPTFTGHMSGNNALVERNPKTIEFLTKQRDVSTFHSTSSDYYYAYKTGKCTPYDVAKAILRAIDESNARTPPLRAIIDYDSAEVYQMALESTNRWKLGKPLSFIDGVPVSVKGQYKVMPYACTGGATFQPVCGQDLPESGLVTRLKQAGAVIIGLANLQEYGAGTFGSNPNKGFQTARNPYNMDCFCGGSSSGSASSIASGICPISLGSDAGGSIRIPASLCGVIGLKPTYGLLDTSGFTPCTATVGVLGPLAASVLDLAIVMDILCSDVVTGMTNLDLTCMNERKTLEGLKIGVHWEYFEHADKEIVSLCKAAVREMISLGAVCINIKIPELDEIQIAHGVTTAAEFGNSLTLDVDDHFSEITPETLMLVGIGYTVTANQYLNCQKQRTRAIRTLEHLFEEVDVIVTPSTACLAPKIPPTAEVYGVTDIQLTTCLMRFLVLANLTGIPGIALPVGISSAGLPASIQIMAPWFEEGKLLYVAGLLEKKVASKMKQPNVYFDILGDLCKE